mgnify:CR=1 FL=1
MVKNCLNVLNVFNTKINMVIEVVNFEKGALFCIWTKQCFVQFKVMDSRLFTVDVCPM